jgi:hypothetical protein
MAKWLQVEVTKFLIDWLRPKSLLGDSAVSQVKVSPSRVTATLHHMKKRDRSVINVSNNRHVDLLRKGLRPSVQKWDPERSSELDFDISMIFRVWKAFGSQLPYMDATTLSFTHSLHLNDCILKLRLDGHGIYLHQMVQYVVVLLNKTKGKRKSQTSHITWCGSLRTNPTLQNMEVSGCVLIG